MLFTRPWGAFVLHREAAQTKLCGMCVCFYKHMGWKCLAVLCRGLPVERYSRKQVVIAYWGISLYWGAYATPTPVLICCVVKL